MKKLTGAAAAAHRRRILLDAARETIRRRDPNAVGDTLALLRTAAGAA